MLGVPSRHDGLPNNQAARDLQRERQRQERAQMLVQDEAGLSPNIQDLFNAPVKVKPSVEDPTSIEIRKTFGSYDSARPFLTENNGALQRRLIGVDQTINTVSGSVSNSSGQSQTQPAASTPPVEPRPPVSTAPSTAAQKPLALAGAIPHRPFSNTTTTSGKGDYQSLFKHIPPASGHSAPSQKGSLLGALQQPPSSSLTYVPGPGQTPLLNHIQNNIGSWNIPTPLSPFPVRKNNKLNNLTIPITFVNTTSLNTTTTSTSEISDVFKQPTKTSYSTQNQTSSAATITNIPLATNTNSSTSVSKSEVKSVGNVSSSVGASASIEKSATQHTFKKPLERNDSRLQLDNIIREMTDVRSPLAAILPKETSPKKITTRRSSKNDERTIEAIEVINDLKVNVSPLSTTGMNSSSSSSSSDSSDSDSDSDSSSGSERTTPSANSLKSTTDTTRSPTERESWGLSSFVGGIRKENALIEAASTSSSSLEPAKSKNVITLEISDSISEVLKPEVNIPSSTSGITKLSSNPSTVVLDSTKALNKSTGFIKPSVPQSKSATKDSAIHKGTSPGDKGTVLPKPIISLPPSVKATPALLSHKDPSLSASSSEDESPPPVTPVSAKEKEKEPEKLVSKGGKVPSKRLSTTTIESTAAKKPRRSSQAASQHAAQLEREKVVPKVDDKEKQAKSKSLDRNKNDMIGKLFRPKKEKADEGGKDKEKDKDKDGGVTSASPRDEKTGKFRAKSPTTNRVSAKDSGRKRNSSPGTLLPAVVSSGKTNGEVKTTLEKVDKVGHSTGDSKSKRSTSPTKGVVQKPSGSGSTSTTTSTPSASTEKSDKSKHSSSKAKKSDRETLKGGRASESSKAKPSSSPKSKPAGDSSKNTKQRESPRHKPKTEVPVSKSSSSTSTTSKSSSNESNRKSSTSSSGKSSSSTTKIKSETKSMPPPPAPLPSLSPTCHSPRKDSRSGKKDSKAVDSAKSPSSLLIRIPINILPRGPKPQQKTDHSSANSGTASTTKPGETKGSREVKKEKEDGKQKNVSTPSLVGSSVEDVTDTHVVPSKSQRSSGGYDQLSKTTSKDHNSSSSSKSHKRSKSHSHSSSKKPRLKDDAEVEVKVQSEKNSAAEMSSVITAYTPGSTPAKTPPDPPDSSLNPTHSSSPILAVPQPQYLSYFEKGDSHEDFYSRDQSYYLNQAKTLKHKADKEEPGLPQTITYMESTLFFILTGVIIEKYGAIDEAQGMFEQTFNLIRQIAVRPRMGSLGEDLQEVKLLVLTFRIQALLSLQLYKVKATDITEFAHNLMEYLDPKGAHHQEVAIPLTHSPRAALSTPSPKSPPVPSPAGSGPASVGSVTAPSTHSPHHAPSQQHVALPKYLYRKLSHFCSVSRTLITAHEHWTEADNYVQRFHVQDFFISIERKYGPLTLHSSLLDLVRYVRCGLKNLKNNMNHMESS